MTQVILTEAGAHALPDGPPGWLTAAQTQAVTGWELKPEGMCRGEVCVPLPSALSRYGRVDIAGFWRHIGAPVVSDDRGQAISLGVAAEDRRAALDSLDAPDFTLPDLAGRPHRLADYRGRKILLVTWASW
jgi:hypothetical protein